METEKSAGAPGTEPQPIEKSKAITSGEVEMAQRVIELRHRALFDRMSEGFVLLEAAFNLFGEPDNLRILEANPAFEALAGVSDGSAAGLWISEVLPDSSRLLIPRLGPIAINGQSEHFEYRNPRSKHDYEAFAFSPAAGQCACILLDVSARRRLEEAQHARCKKLESALSAATVGVWELNLSSKALVWSPESYLLHGLTPSQAAITAKDWTACIHPQDAERLKKYLAEAAHAKSQEFRIEYRVLPHNRPCRWLLAVGRFVDTDERAPLRLCGVTVDISQQRAEKHAGAMQAT